MTPAQTASIANTVAANSAGSLAAPTAQAAFNPTASLGQNLMSNTGANLSMTPTTAFNPTASLGQNLMSSSPATTSMANQVGQGAVNNMNSFGSSPLGQGLKKVGTHLKTNAGDYAKTVAPVAIQAATQKSTPIQTTPTPLSRPQPQGIPASPYAQAQQQREARRQQRQTRRFI
jgi:hypothetical protein